MERQILNMLLLATLSIMQAAAGTDFCTKSQWLDGTLYPAPGTNCTHFWQCAPASNNLFKWVTMPCAPGTLFNQAIQVCDHEANVNCAANTCDHTIKEHAYCTNDQWTNGTLYQAPGNDCTKYRQCTPLGNGKFYWAVMPCAPGTVWNQNAQVCDHSTNGECKGINYCTNGQWLDGTLYPAPGTSCTHYWQCAPAGNNLFQWKTMPCAQGTLFNQAIQVCDHSQNVVCSSA